MKCTNVPNVMEELYNVTLLVPILILRKPRQEQQQHINKTDVLHSIKQLAFQVPSL